MNYNKVTIAGRLTKDPDIRMTPSGLSVANLSIAINRKVKGEEETTFVEVTAFAKVAETIGKHFGKGEPIFIEGRLKLDQWQDKATGANRSKLSVVADSFQFVGKSEQSSQPTQAELTAEPTRPSATVSDPEQDDDDDVPF